MAFNVSKPQNQVSQTSSGNFTFALVILTSLFFMWGFLTCLNDILIPHLKAIFSLNYTQVMLIQFCFFTAYFLVSYPAGIILEKIGYQKGIVLGLITASIGCFMFYPASIFINYNLFLLALFILAGGITILQVAANPYVTILGKPETSSIRLNLTQAFNSLGTTLAPFFGSALILSSLSSNGSHSAQQSAQAVQMPYIGLALTLLVIGLVFALIKLPKVNHTTDTSAIEENNKAHKSIWHYRHLILGAIAIFVYVGGEVSIGSFLVNYFGDLLKMPEAQAAQFVAYYWGGAMIGRFIGSGLQTIIRPNRLLAGNALIASALVIISMLTNGHFAMWAILAVGLFNSIMFPTIFSLSLSKLGIFTEKGSGVLCMAIVGGAIIPVIQGAIADKIGIHHAFILPVLCYLYIFYFGIRGYKPTIK